MNGRWREWWARLADAVRGRPVHRELDDEFQSHLDLATDDYVGRGLTPVEARRLAAAKFGSRLAARERVDDQRGWPSLDAMRADLGAAARGLCRAPGFAMAAVLVLGLGIGVNMAVFTVANATLFRGFRGIADQDRLVYLTSGPDCCLSHQDLVDWRSSAASYEGLGAVADLRVAFDAGSGAETATATEVSAETFGVLRVHPALGRDFLAADDEPGAPAVAIVTDRFWRTHFGADPAVLDRTVRVNGTPTTLVGVMPTDFVFPQSQDLWLPLRRRASRQPRDARGLWFAVGRLAEGVTIDQARAELEGIGARLAAAYPATNRKTRPAVRTFREMFVGRNAVVVYGTLWGAVGLVLLIACANLANLLLARAAGRTREMAVRLALGAGRGRIVRQQLFESTLLSMGGGALGAWIAHAAVRGYAAIAVAPTQPWSAQLLDYSTGSRGLGYLVALSLASGVLVGLLPALRLSGLDVHAALRDGGRGTVGRHGRRRLTGAIVAAQVALAVVLLSAAGVLVRSFLTIAGRDLGFDPSRILTTLTMLPEARYPDTESRFAYYDRLVTAIAAVPGVAAVGLVDGVTGQGGGLTVYEVDGRPVAEIADPPQARIRAISPHYFDALGTAIATGRDFDDRDGTPDRPVAIVNRRFAAMHWSTDDAIGRRVRLHSGTTPGPWLTIVGVSPDVRYGDSVRPDIEPAVYVPQRQRPGRGAWVLARTSVPPASLAVALRQQMQRVDPDLPLWLGPYTFDTWMAGTYWQRGMHGGLFALFAVMALLLACLGLFAVVAGSVTQRTAEIGVRLAVGATAGDILLLVLRQALAPAVAGLALGLVASVGANHLLAAQLVEVAPADPLTLVAVAALLIATTALGCLVPASRAMRVDPVIALRLD